MSADAPDEVIFEITKIGDVQRVAVVHVATGTEVVFQTPATAALADLRALGRQLLKRKLAEGDQPKGAGIIV
ncbi:MAG: serine hydroxymethyltransferase [Proteobacteria bacterium]|nr:serine hydroxymethyltransferase [Pseudomonadota bacterium]